MLPEYLIYDPACPFGNNRLSTSMEGRKGSLHAFTLGYLKKAVPNFGDLLIMQQGKELPKRVSVRNLGVTGLYRLHS